MTTLLPLVDPITSAGNTQLIVAALLGIATVVVLITVAKFHPFLGLLIGTAVMGAAAGVAPLDILTSFKTGFGTTMGTVGILIALGAMVGKILADTGGSDAIVETIVGRASARMLPWAMALIAAILGLPLFFEIGVVLLVPVVLLVARRTDVPVMRVGIPALAGLSVLHGLVPPHPGPLVAIANLNADLGQTLIFGLIIAVPTLILCGPLLARVIETWVPVHVGVIPGLDDPVPALVGGGAAEHEAPLDAQRPAERRSPGGPASGGPAGGGPASGGHHLADGVSRRPSFGAAVACIVLPVVLMLVRAVADIVIDNPDDSTQKVFDVIGDPVVALLAGVLVAMWVLGFRSGMNRSQVERSVGSGLPAIAGILLIVAAGGGFKQMLVDAGVGSVIGDWANGSGISPLVLGWLVAVGVRLATGSATVATITASGIVASLATDLPSTEVSLLVLAIGCGSLFFSHVNDAGFWLVKEYFGRAVGQTSKSWSVMETAISVVGFVLVLLLNLVV
jgi:GntP family gluconate:H+ symporter